ncbi:hypothetical protein PV08_10765 [Exophiala spinifera]|uniref:NAD(P)-binding domain-containing protein n=1 Tax=Exophiala spinifera TaxID=91928 RepID=A0A0D2AYK0_9EURO|nr:uncharacterized protein PV08_10765 [Exophiala spinifera]KIW11465.1 hypothetical protein PV08_10765 [Exophiala spinifera]
MAGDKILVLGGTGPAGVCVLRELAHRGLPMIVYARSPSKIPSDLASDVLVEVIKGDMNDREALSTAVAKSKAIISLLGPNSMRQPKNTEYADYYRTTISLMEKHGVRRLFALGTTAIYQPEDHSSVSRFLMARLIKLLAGGAYHNFLAIQELFERDQVARDIDWTVFRVGNLSGSAEAEDWKTERGNGAAYAGPVAGSGWTNGITRSTLAKWLVDGVENGAQEWIHQMPAVSELAGDKAK